MAETADNYWVCAYGYGLVKMNKNWDVLKIYNEKDGLSNTGVYKLFKGRNNLFFVTSNDGLSVVDQVSGKIKKIYQESGLHADTFEEATGSSKNDEVFTGGPGGFSVFSFIKKLPEPEIPGLYINNISYERRLNKRADTFSNNFTRFRIPNDYTQVTIRFSGIYYNNPQKITYNYKIQEIQPDWVTLNNQAFINLIGIKPGTYHLQVQAFNEDGVGSEIKELTLIFLPKWYQTWWFKTFVLLSVIAAAYGLYRMRINQLKKEEKIRNQLAGDLHDDLGSTLNSIKVHTNLALLEKEKPEHLEHVKQGAQDAISGVRDIIWVLDDKKDKLSDMLARVSQFAAPLCQAANINYSAPADDDTAGFVLGKEEKRNLYMICKESINNSIKYATCKNIEIKTSVINKKLKLLIMDNGKGFDKEKITAGNGLKNIAARAKAIHYHHQISSTPGSGTVITLEKS
jgi:signal transduction histidine kinase